MMIGSPGGRPGGLGKGSGKVCIRGLLVRTADRCNVVNAGIGSLSRHGVAGQTPVRAAGRVTSPMAAVLVTYYAMLAVKGTGSRTTPVPSILRITTEAKPPQTGSLHALPEIGFVHLAGAAQLGR